MAPIIQVDQPRFRVQSRYGRRYAPDARDFEHPMVSAIRAMPKKLQRRRTKAPQRGPTLNQDVTPECVEYSLATSLGALPIGYGKTPEKVLSAVQVPISNPEAPEGDLQWWPDLYTWAQAHDEWPGEDYEGTSVRAGQEYLKLIGLSSGYSWARNLDEMKDYISREGSAPIIIGIDYTADMETPKKIRGKYYLEPTGAVVGGHAMCVLWFDKLLNAWKLQQTWGEEFGDRGVVYIADEGMDILVFRWNGEAVSYTEVRKAA